MSKNIIIQEGGIPKQMTVSKIKVNDVGGSTSLWVPEDTTTLATKSVSKNGTYKASSDNAYGYSQVTVNVAGGDGSAASDGKPTTSHGVNPGTSGSAVVGKDTSGVISGTPGGDGNEYAIGIDGNGNIVATKVPSGIEIGKSPDRTSYVSGDTIDYSGIIVILKGGDSAMFSNSDYPNGRVPFSELIFPKSVADIDEAHEGGGPSDLVPYPINFASSGAGINRSNIPYTVYPASGSGFMTHMEAGDRAFNSVYASESPGTVYHVVLEGQTQPTDIIRLTNTFTHNGKTVYYTSDYGWAISAYPLSDSVLNQYPASYIAWSMIYSGGAYSQEIPVQWKSPYDGRTFEDTFDITVTASGSGYSDGSGGSESGGGGGF